MPSETNDNTTPADAPSGTQGSSPPAGNAPDSTPPKKKRKRPRLVRSVFVGAAVGGGLALLLLVVFTVIVTVHMLLARGHDPAASMTKYLFGIVCFGPVLVLLCTLIGSIAGFLRTRL